jgi:hypothetical protein
MKTFRNFFLVMLMVISSITFTLCSNNDDGFLYLFCGNPV